MLQEQVIFCTLQSDFNSFNAEHVTDTPAVMTLLLQRDWRISYIIKPLIWAPATSFFGILLHYFDKSWGFSNEPIFWFS